ncbi:MAG: iron ABC transporter permease [Spirochaetales bacterium]|nr:iron ABC transporter permease [Spirochaetales bacterium]
MKKDNPILYILILLILIFLSLLIGRYPRPGIISPGLIFSDPLLQKVILQLRLPRMIVALLLGASLGGGGLVMQTIMANPLVEPGFLGVSQGAAFGAALAIMAGASSIFPIQLSAVVFAIMGLAFSYFVAKRLTFGGWILRLLLAGIITSALFTAGIGVIKSLADPMKELQEITFWMMGGLWGVGWKEVLWTSPVVLLCLSVFWVFRWRINLLSLDDRISFSLGTSPEKLKVILLVCAVIAVALVISVSGLVGWIGLIAPHLARRIFGADTRYSLPGAVYLGACGTLIFDDLARTIMMNEIPLGIITSSFGALIFLIIMTGRTGKYSTGRKSDRKTADNPDQRWKRGER